MLILTYFFLQTQNIKAQCNIDDWFALRQLYLSTNGDNWDNNTGWEEVTGNTPTANCNLHNLYGVHLDGSGRVAYLDIDGEDELGWTSIPTGNNLTGSIPQELGFLSNLTSLSLAANNLSGGIPIELNNLTNLAYLRLDGNNLTGSIPTWLGNLTNLEGLWLSSNQFSGSIPTQLGNLIKLKWLGLSHNQLTGNIPTNLGNLINMEGITLDQNQLSGSIPTELGNLTKLIGFSFSGNQLSGSIPIWLGNFTKLEGLWMQANQFSGNIPPELGNLTNLTHMGLCCNQLSGSIPVQLENLSNLTKLYLQNNQLCGSIPPELGNLLKLDTLLLSNNELSGNLPPQLMNLNNLNVLHINHNNLSGCYSYDINTLLCEQLVFPDDKDGDYYISNGNNFDTTWSDMCLTGQGVCPSDSNVYPGDLNHDGIVNNQDVSLSGFFLYNVGPSRAPAHQNNQWYPHPASDWDILNSQNKDIKHHDCNGDGVIDVNDRQAIEDNMGEVWDSQTTLSTKTDPMPPCKSDYQVLLQPIEQIHDGYLVMNVALERRTGGNLTLQGGHFTVDYSDVEGTFISVLLNLEAVSWLGIPNSNLWYEDTHFPVKKTIEVGFTKTNNVDSEGSGVIGKLILEYDTGTAKRSNTSYNFEVSTIGVHQNNGSFIPIEDQQLEIIIDSNICHSNLIINEEAPFQNLYQSSNKITINGLVLIGKDQEVEYNASKVRINSGFSVKVGAEFKLRSGGCN